MKPRLFAAISLFAVVSLLLPLLASSATPTIAQGPQLPRFPHQRLRHLPGGLNQKEDVARVVNTEARTQSRPQITGGPDDYGYIYDNGVGMSWINALGGPNTGLSSDCGSFVAVPIGFSFKFYENTYSTIYVGYNGVTTFDSGYSGCFYHGTVPQPSSPNNVIAPFWAHFAGAANKVHYLQGGTAPNRYLAVEWYQVTDRHSAGSNYTFEAVLYENGDIVFQYLIMNYTSGHSSAGAGIEDSLGLTGLAPYGSDAHPSSGNAVRFYRPAPSARVALSPMSNGAFGAAGTTVQFKQVIRNTGELGTDTYDLLPSSIWPTTLYAQDGVTPLVDTDADNFVDTGPIPQGSAKTLIIKVAVPVSATVGQSNNCQLLAQSSLDTGKSKLVPLQVTIPAMFAQSYSQDFSPYAGFYRPSGQITRHTTPDSGGDPAVATTPDGRVAQVWSEYRINSKGQYIGEPYYALLDKQGNIVRPATRIVDHSNTTVETYDYTPGIAVAPNGNIAITWYTYQWNPANGLDNDNIFYLVLNSAGVIVVPPTNLTNVTGWGLGNTNVPWLWNPSIAATTNNRFVIAWNKQLYSNGNYPTTIWYTVRDSAGGQIRGLSQLGASTSSWEPNLARLADSSVLLSQYLGGTVAYSRLDSAGNILSGPTTLTAAYGDYPDAAQLPNGNVVMVWEGGSSIQYAILNSSLSLVKSATTLPDVSPEGNINPSVTYSGNRAIITWGDACCGYQPNLYYALLDGVGNLLTPPMIFASDNTDFSMQLPYNGQGNTYLIDNVAPASQASSPKYSVGAFPVTWNGTDADSGVVSYDIQVRDGVGGTWTTWLAGTTALSATYTSGVAGHTYYFRSVAHDAEDNIEVPPVSGDTDTTVAAFKVAGSVFNNRHQPVFNASVETHPSALNIAKSSGVGDYTLFLSTAGVYSATASRSGFGALPPQRNLSFNGNTTLSDFVLPPISDAVTNGGWETGDFTGWAVDPASTATIEMAAAHTGIYGLRLDANSAITTVVPSVSQTVAVTGTHPALSWLYRVTQGNGEDFLVAINGDGNVETHSLTLTPGEWTHTWLDLTSFAGQTVTITLGFKDQSAPQQLYLDEISVGHTQRGVYPTYLPMTLR